MRVTVVTAANELNEHEQGLVRVSLLEKLNVHEQFMNTYQTRFYVRVCLLKKHSCSCLFVNFVHEHK